ILTTRPEANARASTRLMTSVDSARLRVSLRAQTSDRAKPAGARGDGSRPPTRSWILSAPADQPSPDMRAKAGEPGGNRTPNPQIKSLLLCQLSYRRRNY